jgi:hypothetical protein
MGWFGRIRQRQVVLEAGIDLLAAGYFSRPPRLRRPPAAGGGPNCASVSHADNSTIGSNFCQDLFLNKMKARIPKKG